jgi:hypothetical protein
MEWISIGTNIKLERISKWNKFQLEWINIGTNFYWNEYLSEQIPEWNEVQKW